MKDKFKQAKELIDASNKILLTMHERMDGDDGGSVLAMLHVLEKLNKQVTASIKQGVPESLQFLPKSKNIIDDITHEDFDLLITFGCSNIERTGSEKIKKLKITTINIDHHPDNSKFGHTNLVDHKKSSVAELVFDFFNFCNWEIDHQIATCLLTGIITDTGSFMYNNTTPSTLEAAAELMRKGAQTNKIIKETFKGKSPEVLKAWARAMENSFYDKKNNIIYSVITDEDLNELGDLPKKAFDGVVETLNTIPEAKFAMFVKQEGEVIKGSLRSDPFKNTDVAQIAKLFGGGGHKLAAGFSLVGKLKKTLKGKWEIQ